MALERMQDASILGRKIEVNSYIRRSNRNHLPNSRSDDHGEQSERISASNIVENAYVFDRWTHNDAHTRWTAPQDEGRRLYVGGLPRIRFQPGVNAAMRRLFHDYNIEAVSKIISPHWSKLSEPGSHYYCFVDLTSASEARRAPLALHGTSTPYGGIYQVRICNSRRPTKVVREQLGGSWPVTEATEPVRNLEGNWRSTNAGVSD